MKLPHIVTFKRRWLRRAVIVLMIPTELFRAIRGVFTAAKRWWDWDGAVMGPDHVWDLGDGRRVPVPIFKD